jgi:hypothetical protein
MSRNSREALNPMSNMYPNPSIVHDLILVVRLLSEGISLIPNVGLRFPLDQNPHALISATISRVRIHERGLIHFVKLVGSDEPNFQHGK